MYFHNITDLVFIDKIIRNFLYLIHEIFMNVTDTRMDGKDGRIRFFFNSIDQGRANATLSTKSGTQPALAPT